MKKTYQVPTLEMLQASAQSIIALSLTQEVANEMDALVKEDWNFENYEDFITRP